MPVSHFVSHGIISYRADFGLTARFKAYHSAWNEDVDSRVIGNMNLLPFATKVRGPVGGGGGAGGWSGESVLTELYLTYSVKAGGNEMTDSRCARRGSKQQ